MDYAGHLEDCRAKLEIFADPAVAKLFENLLKNTRRHGKGAGKMKIE